MVPMSLIHLPLGSCMQSPQVNVPVSVTLRQSGQSSQAVEEEDDELLELLEDDEDELLDELEDEELLELLLLDDEEELDEEDEDEDDEEDDDELEEVGLQQSHGLVRMFPDPSSMSRPLMVWMVS